jgi:hypothetical protein
MARYHLKNKEEREDVDVIAIEPDADDLTWFIFVDVSSRVNCVETV